MRLLDQQVAVRPAIQAVVAQAAGEGVKARPALQAVAGWAANQLVVTGPAIQGHRAVKGGGIQRVGRVAASEAGHIDVAQGIYPQHIGQAVGAGQVGGGQQHVDVAGLADLISAGAAIHGDAPLGALEGVVALAAHQRGRAGKGRHIEQIAGRAAGEADA